MNLQKYILLSFLIILFLSIWIIHRVFKNILFKNATTNIWNSTRFLKEAKKLLKSDTQDYAMLQFNIAKFRYLNDSFGHETGDKILRCFAKCIATHMVEKNEIYCSVWGDYFAVLLKYTSADILKSRVNELAQIFTIKSDKICNFRCILKCGISLSICNSKKKSEQCRDGRNLIEKTNFVINSIPEPYTTTLLFYTEKNEEDILFFKKSTLTINKALKNNQFQAFFQPKYNIHSGRICGAEALVRWINDANIVIFPDLFIPYCENTSFIIEIDRTIFEQTCKFLHDRLKEGKTVVPISSNFSRLHAQNPDLPEYIKSVTKKYEVPSNLIEIELTETTAVEHQDVVFKNFHTLRQEGFLVAIDDFGSGYSSLAVLEQLDIDVIKMDQSFLRDRKVGMRDFQVLSSMIHLAKNLGLTVICEGVETPDHVLVLDRAGGEIAQGFFYSQPISAKLFNAELDKRDTPEGLKENVDSLKKHFKLSFLEDLDIIADVEELKPEIDEIKPDINSFKIVKY